MICIHQFLFVTLVSSLILTLNFPNMFQAFAVHASTTFEIFLAFDVILILLLQEFLLMHLLAVAYIIATLYFIALDSVI